MPSKKKTKKKPVQKAAKKAVKKPVPIMMKKRLLSLGSAKAKAAKPLPKKELDFYEDLLLTMRAKIVGDLQHLESDSLKKSTEELTGDHADVIDTAQDEFEREFVLNLAANEQQILNKIDVALRRIKDGTYGICEKYGVAIPKKRLMALPYTTMSLQAQEEQEKGL